VKTAPSDENIRPVFGGITLQNRISPEQSILLLLSKKCILHYQKTLEFMKFTRLIKLQV